MTGHETDGFPMGTDEHTITGGGTDTSPSVGSLSRRPALLVQRGPTIGDWHLFGDDVGEVIVGRGEAASFQLRDASVSRDHATATICCLLEVAAHHRVVHRKGESTQH